MTQDEIIEMARQAGAARFYPEAQAVKEDSYLVGQKFLEAFAKLIAAKEREDCAQLCENSEIEGSMGYGQICADIIRARSNS